ncbi:pancreatic triacylglycerol lipase-like [Cydia amplana]|uniref:pancreatic triacylglycerol lipase-like n=1 Tax=Cydia amplana TaxID=1869771 RepID=UPI002FE6A5A4
MERVDGGELWMNGVDFYEEIEHGFKDYAGYGTQWIFFPDGAGIPHFVNLTMPTSIQLRGRHSKEIEYRLYTRELSDYIILDQSAEPPNSTDIRELLSNKAVKLVTHGWKSSAEDSVVMGIKESYLKHKDVAVIGIDWSDTAKEYLYPLVAEYTRDVGAHVGQFLDAFCHLYNVSGKRLHLIGHSLGAHVMGIAASKTNVTIARITGR